MIEPITINLRLVARDMNFPLEQLQGVVELLDAGFPVPFIARYRKDQTGNLDEEHIREIQSEIDALRKLSERKEAILRSIDTLGKLTAELDKKIREAKSSKRLEDLYLPYKPKKQTLASVAREKGLEPLALEIIAGSIADADMEKRAADFVDADKKVPSLADAILGAGHIISEIFSEKVELRHQIREIMQRSGVLRSIQIDVKQESPEEKKEINTEKPKKERRRKNTLSLDSATEAEQPTLAETVFQESVQTQPEEDSSGSGGGADISDYEDAPMLVEAIGIRLEAGENSPSSDSSSSDPDAVLQPPASSLQPVDDGDVVSQQFQEWKENLKEKGIPVVRSQKQLEKKRKTDARKKRLAEHQSKQNEHFTSQFQDYFEFQSEIKKLTPHRILALNRGERSKVLRIALDTNIETVQRAAEEICVTKEHPHAAFLSNCAADALNRLVLPSLEREARADLTENAELHALRVFARNLRNLLLQPPLQGKRVLAMDPGFRHGCKLAALDEYGNVLANETIYLVSGAEKREKAVQTIIELANKFDVTVFAIGNGTACRETELFVSEIIEAEKDKAFAGKDVAYVIVNEAGASVYSASPAAKEEFPLYDVLLRGAISIGRRLQDPLNELVKVDPSSLGVGMYQHDVKAKHLRESLDAVVESCVNYVGVDLNTATPAILRYVAGLNQLTAKRIYEYRMENGPFKCREELKNVSGYGNVAFTHSAGFLRIVGGSNPLDSTWIHPESYELATAILQKLGFSPDDLIDKKKEIAEKSATLLQNADSLSVFVSEIYTPEKNQTHTINDILGQFAKPGLDPRESLPAPVFKKGVLKMEDLYAGMELTGTILNVVDFGAFVDIGMHEAGLIHISHIADKYVKDAHEFVSVGDIVRVWVVGVNPERQRISLSLIPLDAINKTERKEAPLSSYKEPREPRPKRDWGPKAYADSAAKKGVTVGVDIQQPTPKQLQPRRDFGPKAFAEAAAAAGRPLPTETARPPRPQHEEERHRENYGEKRNDERPRAPFHGGKRPPYKPREDSGKTYVAPLKEKSVVPISDDMKKGKEPLRSFGDLAQLLGRVAVPNEQKKK